MPQIPGRRVLGERLGGYIYGTMVVLATVVAGAEAYRDGAGHIVLLVLMTTFVFWLAHVYAHALGHSVSTGKRISGDELVRLAAFLLLPDLHAELLVRPQLATALVAFHSERRRKRRVAARAAMPHLAAALRALRGKLVL